MRVDPAYAADEYSGNIYPAVINVYATFGNILGAFVIMELIKIAPLVPVPLSFPIFDLFDGFVQAYVFVFFFFFFIKETIE